jgi:hypothetical protein
MRRRAVIAITACAAIAVAIMAAQSSLGRNKEGINSADSGKARVDSPSLPFLPGFPRGVTLRQIDGGPRYYANISPRSAWMDRHVLLGAWDEQPLNAADVKDDVKIGDNVYWNLAGDPLDTKDCGGVLPCRVNFDVIRAEGMHASAPDTTSKSGAETVAYEGGDEVDMKYGPGASGWNPHGPESTRGCIPSGSQCGYTVAQFYYSGNPAKYGATGYPARRQAVIQGYGKGVLFWESDSQAKPFMKYSDTLSADSYWMTDADLDVPSQGGCALLPQSATACGHYSGHGLTTAQRALPANYGYNVTRLEGLSGRSKPVTVDIETGCPTSDGECTTPAATQAAAWHALIAGARGIIWFQHNFSGPCVDFNTFYDGSKPTSPMYRCQQTPGVTLHDVVEGVSAFSHLVDTLNAVLLAPFAQNYVSVGNADISAMAKYYKGIFYIFAASGKPADPPGNNLTVRFKLAGEYTGPVSVVGEHRTLRAVDGVFTDKFANADSVHIYKIGR